MRTWEENKTAINQLWPMAQFTDEERKLWGDDLRGLDQVVLYDAIRNVKRNSESLYPQIKWIRDEYRRLDSTRKWLRPQAKNGEQSEFVKVVIDSKTDAKMRDELRALVEVTEPSDFKRTVDIIADKAARLQIELGTAFRLVRYLLERLGLSDGGQIGGAA